MTSSPGMASTPSLTVLFTSLAEESADSIVVISDDGSIQYMNATAGVVTGLDPDRSRGTSIFTLVHPEDLDRAIFDLGVHTEPDAPPGWSTYRVRTASGSWLPMTVTTAEVTDGANRLLATFCRPADIAPTEVLFGLLRGASAVDALLPVLDMFNRKTFGSMVSIAWFDDEALQYIGPDVPPELSGNDMTPETPWAACWRDAVPQIGDRSALDTQRRAAATQLGLDAFWIEPVVVDDSEVQALITVWMREGGPSPEYHTSGMSSAKNFVELILRWTRQVRLLDEAAHRDPLTGLANRKAFFDALATGGPGAVLYCDLDRFKPVNDELGHRAGDQLLLAVARRIQRSVGADEMVVRLGGDEFAVLCDGATKEQALRRAEGVRAAIEEPFLVEDETVSVGISIGIGHTAGDLGEAVLESADRALYQAKADGGGEIRLGSPDGAEVIQIGGTRR